VRPDAPARIARAALAGFALLAAAAAAPSPQGAIELRITDHRAGIDDFVAVHVAVAEVLLHRAGSPRSAGWVPVLRDAPPVDIAPLKEGRSAPLGKAGVPAGRYDAVRVVARVERAQPKRGPPVPIVDAAAVVALSLELDPGGRAPLLLDFYLEDQTDHHPPRYELKLRRATPSTAVPAAARGPRLPLR
jgi:hypothetical protein